MWGALAANACLALYFALLSPAFGGVVALAGAPPALLLALRSRPGAFRAVAAVLGVAYVALGVLTFFFGGMVFLASAGLLLAAAIGPRAPAAPRAPAPPWPAWKKVLAVTAVITAWLLLTAGPSPF